MESTSPRQNSRRSISTFTYLLSPILEGKTEEEKISSTILNPEPDLKKDSHQFRPSAAAQEKQAVAISSNTLSIKAAKQKGNEGDDDNYMTWYKTPEVRQLTLGRGVSVSLLHSCTPKAPGLLHSSCGCMYGHERKEGVGQGAAHSLSPGAPSLQALAGNSSCATAFGEYLNYL